MRTEYPFLLLVSRFDYDMSPEKKLFNDFCVEWIIATL